MAQILLIGPDRERAAGVRSLLRRDGHRTVWHRSVENWRERERQQRPEIVVAAIASTDAMLSVPGPLPPGFPAPLLFVQHETDFFRDVHVHERLVDRLASPFLSEELCARVDALVRVRRAVRGVRQSAPNSTDTGSTSGVRQRLALWIKSRLPRPDRPLEPYLEVAARVAEWADRRDGLEPGHAERVAHLCALVAETIGMDVDETDSLLRAAMLHDIGKIALPVEVLHQRRPLDEAQQRLIRTHPARGAALLRALAPDDGLARTVLYHHERPDGKGYYGKEGEAFPRAARVLAVAEALDAMTRSLVRERIPQARALGLLQASKGVQYDRDSVEALTEALTPRRRIVPLARP